MTQPPADTRALRPRSIVGEPRFDLSRPAGRCAATNQPIPVGQRFVSCIVESGHEDHPIARVDFSLPAWNAGARPESTPLAVWQSAMPDPGEPARTLDAGGAMELFDALEEAQDEQRLAFRYVLALMLVRKKKLNHEGGTLPDAKRNIPGVLRVSRRGEPEPEIIDVAAPILDQPTIERLAGLVDRLMQGPGEGAA